jgi:hypothetical protein
MAYLCFFNVNDTETGAAGNVYSDSRVGLQAAGIESMLRLRLSTGRMPRHIS